MAIISYQHHNLSPEVAVSLSEINQYSLRAKAMLTALGDYWTNYYRNLDPIAVATTGSVAAISKEYTHLLDIVKSSNIFDIPIQQSDQFELLVFDYKDVQQGDGYFFVPLSDIVDTKYLTTSLFESRVVLEKGVHYDVIQGEGYKFYVDLFGDKNITDYAYTIGEDSEKHLLMWACDIAFTSTIIYERYGKFLYKKSIDSEKYKWVTEGLMRFYENAKSVQCIQDILNIIYGIPYTRYKDEVVEDIYYVDSNLKPITGLTEEPYICIKTDKAYYYTYAFSDVKYEKGDVVPQFSLLADFNIVEDYISHPKWWEDCAFPVTLTDDVELTPDEQNELMDKVLKYNTVHINLGVSIDSYQTYLSQVQEIFKIIESGFPVYLYPLVDTFVRSRFIDKVDFDDLFNITRVMMGFTSVYDWGQFINFDGKITYYGEPTYTHGRDSECNEIYFNGEYTYNGEAKHKCKDFNIAHFNGDLTYDTDYKYRHNNDRETLTITKISTRWVDTYVRNVRTYTKPVTYNGKHVGDGSITFGSVEVVSDDEFFNFTVKCNSFQDKFLEYAEEVKTKLNLNLKDSVPELRFDGTAFYNGTATCSQGEDFTVNSSLSFTTKYNWEGQPVVTPLLYNGEELPTGYANFDGTVTTYRNEISTMKVKVKPWTDKVNIRERLRPTLNARFSDTLNSLVFDGTAFYNGEASYVAPAIDESFVLKIIPAI